MPGSPPPPVNIWFTGVNAALINPTGGECGTEWKNIISPSPQQSIHRTRAQQASQVVLITSSSGGTTPS